MKMALWRNRRYELGEGLVSDVTPFSLYPCQYFCERRYTDIKEKVDEWQFFRKPSGHIAYNKKCLHCNRKCKQSYRVEILRCLLFDKR